MLVLVTGAAGFIGSRVADALAGAGHDVRGVDALLPAAHGSAPELPPASSTATFATRTWRAPS